MRKSRLLLFTLLLLTSLLPLSSPANNPLIDSLESLIPDHPQDKELVKVYTRLYMQYLYLDNRIATAYAQKAFDLSKKIEYPIGLANSYNNLGLALFHQGNTKKALEYYHQALNIHEEEKFQAGIPPTILNIGIVYGQMEEYEKALTYFEKYKDLNQELGERDLTTAHSNIGYCYLLMACFEEALEQFMIVDKMAKELGLERIQLENLYKIAELYIEQALYQKAIEYGKRALKANEKIGSKTIKMNSNWVIGKSYFHEANYLTALTYLTASNEAAEEIGEKARLRGNYELIYQALGKTAKYKDAYHAFSQYDALNDSLSEGRNEEEIRLMQAKFESERKEAEIALLRKDQEIRAGQLQQSRLLAGLVISVLGLGLFISILIFRSKVNAQNQALTISRQAADLQEQKLREMEKEQKLKALDSHIQGQRDERKRIAKDLHDGLGTDLASIKLHMIGLQNKGESGKWAELILAIDKSCQDVRAISHHLHPPDFGESSFHQILEKFLRAFAKKNNLKVDLACSSIEAANALQLAQQIEMYRIIQEALHNAAKHAQPSNISLMLTFFEDYLNLIIEDDGIGFSPKQIHQGIGLRNIKERAENLQATFDIDSSPGRGSILNFHIPLHPISHMPA